MSLTAEALRQFRATTDPLMVGMFAVEQISLGMTALAGMPVMPSGAVVLKRRRLYPEPGDWEYCGHARRDAATVSQFSAAPHEVDMGYQYAAAAMLGNGYVSPLSEPIRIDFDAGGDIILPLLPMFPDALFARPIAGGKYRVGWSYDAWGQGAPPTDFQIFEGATPATVDYDTALGTVLFTDRPAFYFVTGAFGGGGAHVFGVRARNSAGVAELNTFTTNSIDAEASAPAAATITLAGSRQVGA